MIEKHVERDAAAAAEKAAELFRSITSEAIAARGRCSVALAGGTSPAAMHEALAGETQAPQIKWGAIDFFFGDERAVPSDARESNFNGARTTLLDRVAVDWSRVHPLEAWRSDLDKAAQEYEQRLLDVCPGGALDLLVMGVGEDAHILSLHPKCSLIDRDDGALVAAVRNPPMNPALDRLTLTPTALFRARTVLVLFVGVKKRSAWRALTSREGSALAHPVRLLREHSGIVHCVGDAEAMR